MNVFFIDIWGLNKQDKETIFLSKLSMYQGKLFHLSCFIRQVVALSRELVQFEYLFQTRCLELLITLNSFLRQSVTVLGELVPHERFPQTSGLKL